MISTPSQRSPEVPEGLLKPFVAAAQLAFEQLAGLSLEVRDTYQQPDCCTSGDVSAVIGLTAPDLTPPDFSKPDLSGANHGALVLTLREAVANAAARRVLADLDDNPDEELVSDCVGELANIIAGQARGMLADSPFEFAFGTPKLVTGVGHEVPCQPKTPCVVLDFNSEVGEVQMLLACWPRELIAG
jgi:chemotaxis protein CheX